MDSQKAQTGKDTPTRFGTGNNWKVREGCRRVPTTGVEGKGRSEKGRLSFLQPLRYQAAHPGNSKE